MFFFYGCKKEDAYTPQIDKKYFLAVRSYHLWESTPMLFIPEYHLMFFSDEFNDTSYVYDYENYKLISQKKIAKVKYSIDYSTFNGNPELYIANGQKLSIYNLLDLSLIDEITPQIDFYSINSVQSIDDQLILSFDGYGLSLFSRNSGEIISTTSYVCDVIGDQIFANQVEDSLYVLSEPCSQIVKFYKDAPVPGYTNVDVVGRYVSSIRVSESKNYFIAVKNGNIFSFTGKYLGTINNSIYMDFAISPDGQTIYGLSILGDLFKFSYPDLQQIGDPYQLEGVGSRKIYATDSQFFIIHFMPDPDIDKHSAIYISILDLKDL